MGRGYQTIIIVVMSAVCSGCADGPSGSSSPYDIVYSKHADFFQSWTRSYEQKADPDDEIQHYRPTDFGHFPSSWFTNSYIFDQDGACEWLVLHPADAHYMEPATWRADSKDRNLISIYNPIGTEVVRFKILELAPDYMRIKSLKYAVPRCNYLYGRVDVQFNRYAAFDDIDAFARSLNREYTFLSFGLVFIRSEVISGAPMEIESRLAADENVESVSHVVQSYPDRRDFLVVSFGIGINADRAAEILAAYTELVIISSTKYEALIRFDVPVGREDDWVAFFLEAPLVESSHKAGSFCPPD